MAYKSSTITLLAAEVSTMAPALVRAAEQDKPNIVFFIADDYTGTNR
jgi:hypothetical protein